MSWNPFCSSHPEFPARQHMSLACRDRRFDGVLGMIEGSFGTCGGVCLVLATFLHEDHGCARGD